MKNAGRTFCPELRFVYVSFIFLAQMLTFVCDSGSTQPRRVMEVKRGFLVNFSTLNLDVWTVFKHLGFLWVYFTTTSLVTDYSSIISI